MTPEGGGGDVYIDGDKNRNRAMDGDVVVVRLEEEEGGRADGRDDGRDDGGLVGVVERLDLGSEGNDEGDVKNPPSPPLPPPPPPPPSPLPLWTSDSTQSSLWAPQFPTGRLTTLKKHDTTNPLTSNRRGTVIGILLTSSTSSTPVTVVGLIKPNHNNKPNSYLLHPVTQKMPLFTVPLPPHYSPTALYKASYTSGNWPASSYFPPVDKGTVQLVGEAFDVEAETEALLSEFGINHGEVFSKAVVGDVLSAVESGLTTVNGVRNWSPPPSLLAGRRDFRSHRVFTIDPTTAKDLDDALHILPLADGTGVEVGVHIADVGEFVKEGTAVDEEAKDRATTVYLVDRTIPMLPRDLCEIACSLNEDVDRLAFSCVFQMNYDGTIKTDKNGKNEVWYGKSVIRSCARLDYGTAQNIIEGKCGNSNGVDGDEPNEHWDPSRRPSAAGPHNCQSVAEGVRLMHSVAMNRRALRFKNGALALNRTKVVFRIDKVTNTPYQAEAYPIMDSNRLIEEYMLLANYLVAERLVTHGSNLGTLRHHPPPLAKGLAELVELAASCGVVIDPSNSLSIQRSLDKFTDKIGGSDSDRSLNHQAITALLTSPMQPAMYFCAGEKPSEEWAHFALNIPYYTHFTSPIRRFADVMVHRLLQATLSGESASAGGGGVTNYGPTATEVQKVADNCNERNLMSKKAQDRSDRVFLCLYLKENPVEEVRAGGGGEERGGRGGTERGWCWGGRHLFFEKRAEWGERRERPCAVFLHQSAHHLLRPCVVCIFFLPFSNFLPPPFSSQTLGIVVSMGDKSFTVLVPDLGCEEKVYLDDSLDDFTYRGGDEESNLHGTKCISVVPTAAAKAGKGLEWSVLKVKMFEKVSVRVRCRDEPPVNVRLTLNGPWTKK